MQTTLNGWRWFRTLRADETEKLIRHYLRLGPEGLAARFFRPMGEADLRAYVAGARDRDWQVIGWFHRGVLRGTAELFVAGGAAEAAFAVEPAWRGQGVGTALMAHLRRRAQNRGVGRINMLTARTNTAMIHIAQGQGAQLRTEDGEVQSHLCPGPATAQSLILDLAEEETGILASLAARVWRGLAWPWAVAAARHQARGAAFRPGLAARAGPPGLGRSGGA